MTYVINGDEIDYRAERTPSLRSKTFYLLSFKQLVILKKYESLYLTTRMSRRNY